MAIEVGKIYVVRRGELYEKVVGVPIEKERRGLFLPSSAGKPIRCHVCGRGGGTLVKVARNKYRHDGCKE